LNETLASLYGLEKTITGSEMRRVVLEDPNRGGVLGMPGVLAVTSLPERTSAVKRGVWVLEQVLGQHVPPAPANVPSLEKQDRKKVASLTLRQRTELHRKNPVCANCHKILDPIGFGLENSMPSVAGETRTTQVGRLTPRANCQVGSDSHRRRN
jgi:hypothetical protein